MTKIKYTWDRKRPDLAFQHYHSTTRDQILDQLIKWQNTICEASVQGTDLDREIWSVATTPCKDSWGRAQRHRNKINTMMSALAGAIDKLRSGGDPTEKQAENIKNIAEIMNTLLGTEQWQWEDISQKPQKNLTLHQQLFI